VVRSARRAARWHADTLARSDAAQSGDAANPPNGDNAMCTFHARTRLASGAQAR